MAINCRPFVSYVGDLLIPVKAFRQAEWARGPRQDHLREMGWLNTALWVSGATCSISALVFRFTAEKTLPNTIAKYGIRVYAAVAVIAVVVSFVKFCRYQANQRP